MVTVRIFVSGAQINDPGGRAMANRLIADIQARGAEVIMAPDHLSGHALLVFLIQRLPSCQYCILIQTPASLQSAQVQTTLEVALTLLDQQSLLRFILIPSELEEPRFLWETLRVFDASQDYPRMREKLLLELGLTSFEGPTGDLSLDGWPSSEPFQAAPVKQFKTPFAAPPFFKASPPQEQALSSSFSVADPHHDRPAPAPRRFALSAVKGLFTSMGRRPQQRLDRPSPLPLHRKRLWRRGAMLVLFLILILVVTLGLLSSRPSPSPQPPQTPAHTRLVSPSTTPATVLVAQDTFQRPDQPGWGTASDGHVWGADAVNTAHFSMRQGRGEITGGQGPLDATLGPQVADAEVVLTGSISLFKKTNFGALLRWVDVNTFYKAYIDGKNLLLLKNSSGQMTLLASVPFTAASNTRYMLRFRAQGNTLSARVWPANAPEPAQWMIVVRDTTIQRGVGGVRVIPAPGVTLMITTFQERMIDESAQDYL